MNLLTINGFSKAITDRQLFKNADFSVNEGEKVGVIGVNGTGKSTLLKMITGIMETDSGEVIKANKVKINYLSQNPTFESNTSIYDYVIKKNEVIHDNWNMEGEAKTILNILGFENYNEKIDTLSGGQRKRVALAATLLTKADILVLDEPTNHLDSEMSAWLEDYLIKSRAALVMVTHDRYFLDRVCNRIVEIADEKIYTYTGNYETFLEEKALREDIAEASERKRKSLLRVELEWMQRGARARSTKQKAHIERYEELASVRNIKQADKLEMNSLSSRLGQKTIELSNISKAYGNKMLIKDFSYIFLRNDRIGIIGSNGCGKSTLIKIIMHIILPDEGQIDIGETIKIGYFSQENEYLPEDKKVIDYIRDTEMLKKFLFDNTLQFQQISKLSGGEKRRLYLLKILMEAPNVLILDEPTNDLDIQTMMILEEYLDNFSGIVITVSHDRYFLNRVVSRIFAYESDGRISQYEGNYDDYSIVAEQKKLANKGSESTLGHGKNTPSSNSASNSSNSSKPANTKLKMSYNEMREFSTIDADIAAYEEKIADLEKKIAENSSDFYKLNEYMEEKGKLEEELAKKMDRWVYLNDLNDRINNM